MFCPKCGGKNPDDAKFCQVCGTSFTVKDNTKPILRISKSMKWVVVGIGILMIFIVGALLIDTGDEYTHIVQQGSMSIEPNIPIGKAFDKFFSEGKWRSFKSKQGKQIVEFTGKCNWNNRPATCKIQFQVFKDQTFQLENVSVNDVEMTNGIQLLDTALTGG